MGLIVMLAASPATAVTTEEGRVLDMSNQLRVSVGARPLVFDEALAATARGWAATLAARGAISHNPDLPLVSSGPTAIAENVGVGPNLQMVHDALVASRGHYLNLVNPLATRIGIGIAWGGGQVYVVENFLIGRMSTVATPDPVRVAPATSMPPPARGAAPPVRPPVALGAPGTALGAPGTALGAPGTALGAPVSAGGAPVSAGGAPVTALGAPVTAGGPSAWLNMSLDVLRRWDGAAK